MRIFISNLNSFTTVSQLKTLFIPFGLVLSIKLMIHGETGYSQSAAYIEMEKGAGIKAIQKLNNMRFMNHFILVEETSASTI